VFITYVPVAVELLLNPLSQAWLPKARAGKALWTSSVGAAVAVARRWTLITAPLGFVALGAAVLVLPHVLGEFFRYGVVTMTWVAASILMLPLVFAAMTTLTVLNRYREALAVNVTSVVVAGVVAWTFVPSVGIDGGVAALALSQAVRCGLGLWFLARRGAVPRLVSTVEQGGRS
jgi:O-antigen/teichoic acid export membrane protein